jgi:WD40 repeat protein
MVKFSPDGRTLATGGYGRSAHLWSASRGTLLRRFDLDTEGGLTTEFGPDGTILAIGNRNSMTGLFDTATGNLRAILNGKFCSQELKFDPTGKTLAVVYVDGSLALWDVETGGLKLSVQADADELYTVDWSPDGSLLVTAGRNSMVTLWNAKDLSILNELESPEWVIQARFSPDGTRLYFCGGAADDPGDRHVEILTVR